ncbi:endonuclease/exonuclease/phosphatase family metal-dependent hydrolase [Actinoplanes lutulentus]|uniref:Endonuclease/exonuclease/phosphatase family metal-dependent hydrolase n=1 Tax=Actinoplanes lutulentus TaxID=1287878 RepID=A0A327ZET1_9ACTN|nr:endonuclease/exonuclease/phosphatase family protein [Actinoplanes lutulentus]MBB2941696.1 endonuclease/exonuclease/phosphatase family metal-dependent hydrolase [Actinoplanes lutulentus]RAK39616.1 endonuclease/exonuclease/phosphatase family metal-dependent hydrolase [Actinoplanes lutulentus]
MTGAKLRVVSYNVHGLRDDRPALAGLIRELAPDVLVVQEAPRRFRWRDRCAAFAGEAGLVVAAGGQPALGNLILVSLRVAIHRTWCVRFPLTPGRHLRGAAFAEGSVLGARRFVVTGSHLATDPAERPAQAAEWKAETSEITGPLIVAADLNEGPGGGAWRTVADGLVTSEKDVPTFPATLPQRRIDALFVSPDISIDRYEIIDDERARRASDHLPVVTDLLLPSS